MSGFLHPGQNRVDLLAEQGNFIRHLVQGAVWIVPHFFKDGFGGKFLLFQFHCSLHLLLLHGFQPGHISFFTGFVYFSWFFTLLVRGRQLVTFDEFVDRSRRLAGWCDLRALWTFLGLVLWNLSFVGSFYAIVPVRFLLLCGNAIQVVLGTSWGLLTGLKFLGDVSLLLFKLPRLGPDLCGDLFPAFAFNFELLLQFRDELLFLGHRFSEHLLHLVVGKKTRLLHISNKRLQILLHGASSPQSLRLIELSHSSFRCGAGPGHFNSYGLLALLKLVSRVVAFSLRRRCGQVVVAGLVVGRLLVLNEFVDVAVELDCVAGRPVFGLEVHLEAAVLFVFD